MTTAGKSYEAWKESLEAEAEGDEEWCEDLGEASGPVLRRPGAMEGNGLTAVLVSVGLLVAGTGFLVPKFRHITQGERTVGVVVGHQGYGYGSTGSIRMPIVRYSGPGGVNDTMGSLPAGSSTYPLGKEVWVLYLRNEPRNAVIADFVQLFLIPTVVGGLGLVCLSGTTAFMFWTVRSEVRASTFLVTRRQFTVGDQPQAVNDPANSDYINNDDAEDPTRQREHDAVAQG